MSKAAGQCRCSLKGSKPKATTISTNSLNCPSIVGLVRKSIIFNHIITIMIKLFHILHSSTNCRPDILAK
uniref:Uncharacterized protein n=1 Tax=Arundo donax TaxID=35708 RepID=A0A0A9CWL7_ARUDO